MKNTANGLEEFDGLPVTQYEGKFAGVFDLPDDDALGMAYDDVVTLVVTARVSKTSMDATKFGDMKRSNTFKVIHVTALDEDIAEQLYGVLGGENGTDVE